MITSNIKTLLAAGVVLFINPRSYAGDWGFGSIADRIGWEFKKSIIYHKDGYFDLDLKAELGK